jgi:hypothetical protein
VSAAIAGLAGSVYAYNFGSVSADRFDVFREWLPAAGYEGSASIGGSFVSADIEDCYFTPWDPATGTS